MLAKNGAACLENVKVVRHFLPLQAAEGLLRTSAAQFDPTNLSSSKEPAVPASPADFSSVGFGRGLSGAAVSSQANTDGKMWRRPGEPELPEEPHLLLVDRT